jgi:hypothetical protein
MNEEQLRLPPARSLVNEIMLLHDQIADLVEAQRETNGKLDALLASRQPEVL